MSQGLLTPLPATPEVLRNIPVGVNGFWEEGLVPVGAGLGCDALVGIV